MYDIIPAILSDPAGNPPLCCGVIRQAWAATYATRHANTRRVFILCCHKLDERVTIEVLEAVMKDYHLSTENLQ